MHGPMRMCGQTPMIRDLADVFAIQSEIAKASPTNCKPSFRRQEKRGIDRRVDVRRVLVLVKE